MTFYENLYVLSRQSINLKLLYLDFDENVTERNEISTYVCRSVT